MSNPGKKKRGEPKSDDIFQAPVIVREPVSRQVALGARLTLRVTATGKPLPSFQWFLNGKKISGANSDRLMVNKTRRDSLGAYTCEAKNFVGKTMSRAAMVSFLAETIPNIIVEPAVASVPTGKPFRFRIAEPGPDKLKKLSFQWTFNGKRINGARGPELQFTEVKKKYEGEYKVLLFVGGELRASNTVKLVVLAAEAQGMEMPSRIDIRRPDPAELAAAESEMESAPELTPATAVPAATAAEDLFFNPEDEDEGEGEGERESPVDKLTDSAAAVSSPFSLMEAINPLDLEIGEPTPMAKVIELPTPAPSAPSASAVSSAVSSAPQPRAEAPRASFALLRKKRTLEKLLSHWREKRPAANRAA